MTASSLHTIASPLSGWEDVVWASVSSLSDTWFSLSDREIQLYYSFTAAARGKNVTQNVRFQENTRCGTRFSWKFSGQCYMVFCLFLRCPWLNCAHCGMVWNISSLCTRSNLWQSKLMMSQAVERMWICTGGYRQLRGKWVNSKTNLVKLLLFGNENSQNYTN